MKSFIKAAVLLVITALLTGGVPLPRVHAIAGLDLVRDTVGTIDPGVPDVIHEIYFVLPIDSQQIRPSDWILISMPNYGNITAPTSVSGGFGEGTSTVVGDTVKITDIALLPGRGLTIAGIQADSPNIGLSNSITITIAEDSSGTIVRNRAITAPTSSGGYVSISATVESVLSALSLSGYSAPESFVTLVEGTAVVGTTSTDVQGYFRFYLTGLPSGQHTYAVFSSDSESRSTSQLSITASLFIGQLTDITGLLLSSSISSDTTEIAPGEAITFAGSGKPSSQINFITESPLKSYSTTTDSLGNWSYTLNAAETLLYTPGTYRAYTILQTSFGDQSTSSPNVTFRITTSDTDNPYPTCDISHGDLSCDGTTNLKDFSILLFHWQTNHRVADINGDLRVNLTDFSIMMFYFTR